MKKRDASLEILRILGLLMIIGLHYLGKGNALVPVQEVTTANGYIAWILEAFCMASSNIYILLCGYFMVGSKFKTSKVIHLLMQIWFYSVGITLIFMMLGKLPADQYNIYYAIQYALPVLTRHYWFPTMYMILYLLSPFLNKLIETISKKQYQALIVTVFLLFSGWKSFLPFTQPVDDGGMGVVGFVCLYMYAGYVRKYHSEKEEKNARYMIGYVVCMLLIVLSAVSMSFIYNTTGKLSKFIMLFYDYNSVLVIIGSLSLFIFCKNFIVNSEKVSNFIVKTASCAFGVYLIHEHALVRYLWPKWVDVEGAFKTPYFILHFFVVVFGLYAVCSVIELIRQKLFLVLFFKRAYFQRLMKKTEWIDTKMNG